MRVIHIACVAPPQIGGIGQVAAFEVAQLRARGIDASLVSPTTQRFFWHFGNAAALDLRPIMEDVRNADIVHLHYPFYGTAGIVAQLRKRGVITRLVVTLHMDATARGLKGFYFDLHRRVAQSRILKMADALLVSSLDYARHSSFASLADRCYELPFGVDEKRFAPYLTPSPLSFIRRGGSVLFVGGMDTAHAFKGVEVVLRAMTQMSQNVTLTLVGDGNLRHGYEKFARTLGISSRVKFLGRVSDAELPDVYRSADVFAFPSSSDAEAFGLAALEAQSSGVPVVASDLPGVRTV
ncbi:MAG: glycosyltransferase family 4 protein, partial [Patescibacteria group bacterium]